MDICHGRELCLAWKVNLCYKRRSFAMKIECALEGDYRAMEGKFCHVEGDYI